jgi:selenocysteine lyase/cysteine desulfurase
MSPPLAATFSPYKMFGPHIGVLWCRRALADATQAYKVRPAGDTGAHRFETGTPSFEAQAGVTGGIDYLDWLGGELSPNGTSDRASRLRTAIEGCEAYERELGYRFLAGIAHRNSIRLVGLPTMAGRVPTFALTVAGVPSADVARALASRGIFVWSGHFYAVETLKRLDLADPAGLVRIGFCHYNTVQEVDAVIAALTDIAERSPAQESE